jgi:hypothetical protein
MRGDVDAKSHLHQWRRLWESLLVTSHVVRRPYFERLLRHEHAIRLLRFEVHPAQREFGTAYLDRHVLNLVRDSFDPQRLISVVGDNNTGNERQHQTAGCQPSAREQSHTVCLVARDAQQNP